MLLRSKLRKIGGWSQDDDQVHTEDGKAFKIKVLLCFWLCGGDYQPRHDELVGEAVCYKNMGVHSWPYAYAITRLDAARDAIDVQIFRCKSVNSRIKRVSMKTLRRR